MVRFNGLCCPHPGSLPSDVVPTHPVTRVPSPRKGTQDRKLGLTPTAHSCPLGPSSPQGLGAVHLQDHSWGLGSVVLSREPGLGPRTGCLPCPHSGCGRAPEAGSERPSSCLQRGSQPSTPTLLPQRVSICACFLSHLENWKQSGWTRDYQQCGGRVRAIALLCVLRRTLSLSGRNGPEALSFGP